MTVRETSLEVYREIRANGLLSDKRWEVYDSVYRFGPCTSGEAFKHMSAGRNPLSQSRARFTELRDVGVLKEVGTRKCSVSGNRCIAWDVTAKLPQEQAKRPSLASLRRDVLRRALKWELRMGAAGSDLSDVRGLRNSVRALRLALDGYTDEQASLF